MSREAHTFCPSLFSCFLGRLGPLSIGFLGGGPESWVLATGSATRRCCNVKEKGEARVQHKPLGARYRQLLYQKAGHYTRRTGEAAPLFGFPVPGISPFCSKNTRGKQNSKLRCFVHIARDVGWRMPLLLLELPISNPASTSAPSRNLLIYAAFLQSPSRSLSHFCNAEIKSPRIRKETTTDLRFFS